jgi:SAM-dependent methyltransferase
MGQGHDIEHEQAKLWNGSSGRAWVALQAVLDHLFKPFEDLLVDAVAQSMAASVLDVGCGAGATTLAVARRLARRARCVGIDISEPLIDAARARAEREGIRASFMRADAQTHPFEPASFDMMISRFGVMFFTDLVQAFANLRRAARAGAPLRFVAWRDAAQNPFMTTAERAARPLLPDVPPRRPDGPGQFALADPDRIRRVLGESGWSGIDVQHLDVPCAFPEENLVAYFTHLGPVGLVLQAADERMRREVIATVRAAFDPFVKAGQVRFTAACWFVAARANGL